MAIGRLHEKEIIINAILGKKNLFVYGSRGVGKTKQFTNLRDIHLLLITVSVPVYPVLRHDFQPESDIDILVTFKSKVIVEIFLNKRKMLYK